jgi:hypothetical protein
MVSPRTRLGYDVRRSRCVVWITESYARDVAIDASTGTLTSRAWRRR